MFKLTDGQRYLVREAQDAPEGIAALRAGGRVQRYHQYGETMAQSVAAHSWGVATLIHFLWPDAPRDLLLNALYHDVGEHLTGDVPANAKWRLTAATRDELNDLEGEGVNRVVSPANLPALTPADALRLKIADQLELMLYCAERIAEGDRAHAWGPFWRVANLVCALDLGDSAEALAKALINWVEPLTVFGPRDLSSNGN